MFNGASTNYDGGGSQCVRQRHDVSLDVVCTVSRGNHMKTTKSNDGSRGRWLRRRFRCCRIGGHGAGRCSAGCYCRPRREAAEYLAVTQVPAGVTARRGTASRRSIRRSPARKPGISLKQLHAFKDADARRSVCARHHVGHGCAARRTRRSLRWPTTSASKRRS